MNLPDKGLASLVSSTLSGLNNVFTCSQLSLNDLLLEVVQSTITVVADTN